MTRWSIRRSSPAIRRYTSSKSTAASTCWSTSARFGQWDGEHAAQELEKLVRENRRFWGFLPFKRYLFLNVFRQGGGGLEHKNSTLLTASPPRAAYPARNFRWLSFVSHEYFHAFNVKRLRPVELGPFDYEHPPKTSGLWISEGLTTYFGDLIVVRAGLGTPQDFLKRCRPTSSSSRTHRAGWCSRSSNRRSTSGRRAHRASAATATRRSTTT